MKYFPTLVLFLGIVVLPAGADTLLCAKKSTTVKNSQLKLPRLFKTGASSCPRGTTQIFKSPTAAELLTLIESVDGTGSQLDADTLDGVDKDSFALAADLTSTQATVDSLATTSSSHTSSLSTLNTSVSTAQSDISSHDTRITAVESETRIQNVVRVAAAGGDFTSLSSAISSLSSPSTGNPYLVIVGPGTFTLGSSLTVPSGVTVRGSGINRSIITSSRNSGTFPSASVLTLSNGASIENLTVENTSTAGSLTCVGVYASNIVESNRSDFGSFDTIIKNVRIKISSSGGASHYGVVSNAADLVIRDSIIDIDGSTTGNYGLQEQSGVTTSVYIYDSSIFAGSGATNSRAISVTDISGSGSPQVIVQNTKLYGDKSGILINGASATGKVLNSLVTTNTSSGTALSATDGTLIVNSTTLDAATNSSTSGAGTITCAFITELDGGGHANTCS